MDPKKIKTTTKQVWYLSPDWKVASPDEQPGLVKSNVEIVLYEDGTREMFVLTSPTGTRYEGSIPLADDPATSEAWQVKVQKTLPPGGDPIKVDEEGNKWGWNPTTRAYDIPQGTATPRDTRTPEAKARDAAVAKDTAQETAEKEANKRATGYYETNAQREIRERGIRTENRQIGSEARQAATAEGQLEISRAAEARQAAASAASIAAEAERLGISKEQLELQRKQANRPTPVTAPDTQKNIVMQDAEGKVVTQANPNYDAAKAQAEEYRQRLRLAIDLKQIDAAEAAQRYKQWVDEKITIPFKMAEEQRARAQEQRQAQEAEDRRQQFAATYEQTRQKTALDFGQSAVQNELATLPFRVGPAFGGQFSNAINSLAKGSAEGVNFTADAFMFDRPDFQAIAQKAAAQALKNISPLARKLTEERAPVTADYSGISTNVDFSSAPSGVSNMDINQMVGAFPQPSFTPAAAGNSEEVYP